MCFMCMHTLDVSCLLVALSCSGLVEVCVWEFYIGEPIGTRAVPQFTTHRGSMGYLHIYGIT